MTLVRMFPKQRWSAGGVFLFLTLILLPFPAAMTEALDTAVTCAIARFNWW